MKKQAETKKVRIGKFEGGYLVRLPSRELSMGSEEEIMKVLTRQKIPGAEISLENFENNHVYKKEFGTTSLSEEELRQFREKYLVYEKTIQTLREQ